MGDVFNPQASTGRIGRDEGGKYQVGNIWEGSHLAKQTAKQVSKPAVQAKEETENINTRELTEISTIKAEVQYTISLVKKIDQGQRRPIEYMKSKVKILEIGMIDNPSLEEWSEEID